MARATRCVLDRRGFAHVTVGDHAELQLEDARDALDDIARVGGPARCPTLVDMRQIKSLSKEAREHFRDSTASVCSRVAMLIESPVSRVLGNFFFRAISEEMPKQLFNDEAAAVAWLLSDP